MTGIDSAQPRRASRSMLVASALALAAIIVALVVFVAQRGGNEGNLPGTSAAERRNTGAGGTGGDTTGNAAGNGAGGGAAGTRDRGR